MQKVAAIPYVRTLSHNLKKVAQQYDMKVVFSTPHKLSKLCRLTDSEANQQHGCGIKHRRPFVECAEGVVYQILLRKVSVVHCIPVEKCTLAKLGDSLTIG